MKRYYTIDSIEGSKLFDYKMSEYVVGSYICDRSRFIPVSELAKSVRNESIGAAADLSRYDFPDGKDDGRDVPLARRRPELAEMSVDVKRQQKKLRQQIEDAEFAAKVKADASKLYAGGENASSSNG